MTVKKIDAADIVLTAQGLGEIKGAILYSDKSGPYYCKAVKGQLVQVHFEEFCRVISNEHS